jgi:hypothetical protein
MDALDFARGKEADMRIGKYGLSVALTASLLTLGCGEANTSPGGATSEIAASEAATPEAATQTFLEAVRTGNDAKAASMLTPLARQKTSEKEMVVAPPGSDTATFTICDVELIDSGAHVASDWTDVDEHGRMHTDRIVWILRKVPDGWRIAGMATKVFDDRAPVVLNFEDPDEMLRQQQAAEEEIARRESAQPAKGGSASAPAAKSVR